MKMRVAGGPSVARQQPTPPRMAGATTAIRTGSAKIVARRPLPPSSSFLQSFFLSFGLSSGEIRVGAGQVHSGVLGRGFGGDGYGGGGGPKKP